MCDNDMSVSAAAREMRVVQPSVSKHIADLEKEAGALFVRRGRRFAGITPLGREVLAEARAILLKCDNIETLRRRHEKGGGDLRLGATHLQARYVLPAAVKRYLREFPGANIQIFQNSPANLAGMLENNLADAAICTEALENHPHLDSTAAYTWNRSVIMPRGHELAAQKKLTLKKLAAYPVITYVSGFTGRASFDRVFRKAKVPLHVAVSAADSDVIKTYVRMGAGVGVIASVAYQPDEDRDLARISAAHLFPDMRVRIARPRGKIATRGLRRFMEIFRAHAETIQKSLGAKQPAERGES